MFVLLGWVLIRSVMWVPVLFIFSFCNAWFPPTFTSGYTYLKVASSPYLTGLIPDDLTPFRDVRSLDLEDTGVPCADIWALRHAGYDVSLYMFLPIIFFMF